MYVHPDSDALPHEPRRVRKATLAFLPTLALQALLAALTLALTLSLWPCFLLGLLVWGWPPNVLRPAGLVRALRLPLSERPPAPGLAPLSRAWLALEALRRLGLTPALGLSWHLDELLYGRQLDATPIRAPLVLLSAARSGSTQISHYLEEDPRLAAPSVLQVAFPYLWLWRLAARFGGPAVGQVEAATRRMLTAEMIERHEFDPWKTDTFEVLALKLRGAMTTLALGPRAFDADFNPSHTEAMNRDYWERDFVALMDRVGRKTLRFAGPGPDGAPRRLYVKGHFQAADDALARAWPDAHFLTVVRDPVSRLQSFMNHLHANPFCEPLGALPWSWLAAVVPDMEAAYCVREQDWFTRTDGPDRTVIRFADYVHDLPGTLTLLYGRCFGDEAPPAGVPLVHAERERRSYRVDRSLEEAGVDRQAFVARVEAYRAWCRGA